MTNFPPEIAAILSVKPFAVIPTTELDFPRLSLSKTPSSLKRGAKGLEHKPQQGRIDLTFVKSTLEALRQRLPATLPFDVKSAKAGQSAVLRIAVPRVDHLRPFNEQEDKVLLVFAAVESLLAIGTQIVAMWSSTSDAVTASQQLPQ